VSDATDGHGRRALCSWTAVRQAPDLTPPLSSGPRVLSAGADAASGLARRRAAAAAARLPGRGAALRPRAAAGATSRGRRPRSRRSVRMTERRRHAVRAAARARLAAGPDQQWFDFHELRSGARGLLHRLLRRKHGRCAAPLGTLRTAMLLRAQSATRLGARALLTSLCGCRREARAAEPSRRAP